MCESPTLVHNIETSGQLKTSVYRKYAVRWKKSEVKLSNRLYMVIDSERHTTYSDTFNACRTQAWFVKNTESSLVRVRSNHCNLRWCPLCASSKSWIYSQQMLPWLGKAKYPKFLTLTLKHSDDPLPEQISRIYTAFQKLKKKAAFKKHIFGGVWFFQVVKSKKTQEWHPHLHILLDGKYIAQKLLCQLWQEITGDSYIVHIEAVKDKKKALDYAARYVTRPMNLGGLTDDEMRELFEAFHGRRLCGVFGTARGITFNPDKLPTDGDWIKIGSWDVVMRFKSHDEAANAIYESWLKQEPLLEDVDFSGVDLFIESGGNYNPGHRVERVKKPPNTLEMEPCLWE